MQPKQRTINQFPANNTVQSTPIHAGKPFTKRELSNFLGISERFIELEVHDPRWTIHSGRPNPSRKIYCLFCLVISRIDNSPIIVWQPPLHILPLQLVSTTFHFEPSYAVETC